MTPVTGPGQGASQGAPGPGLDPGRVFGLDPGRIFGLDPGQATSSASSIAVKTRPELRFTALDGLRGLAVPFVLAFALRADLARLNAPAAVQYLADGGYLLVDLFFVLAGFLLCRPLSAILAGTGGSNPLTGLLAGLARRIAPLHLVAWTITFAWVVTGTAPGTAWGWVSSALLLNGITGPEQTGYPASWSVSVALGGLLLLVAAALALCRAESKRRIPATAPGRLVTGIALATGLIGAALLLRNGLLGTEPAAAGTVGPVAIGQALFGFAFGLLSFRVLEGGTGALNPPRPGTAPAPRPAPGLGSLLALAALLFCVYRSDLVHELNLLPIFPVAAGLVYFLAVPHPSGSGAVNRLLDAAPMQWLGSRALAIYLLHGPIQLTVERICEWRGFDRESVPVTYGVIGAVVLGSLVTADLGHRLLERAIAPPAPAPVAPVSVYRIPRSRPERISQIDPETIPRELRLLPLPRKSASDNGFPAAPAATLPTAPPAAPATAAPAALPTAPRTAPQTAPVTSAPAASHTASPAALDSTPSNPAGIARFGRPVGKPRGKPASRPSGTGATVHDRAQVPGGKPSADEPAIKASEVMPKKPAAKAPRPSAGKANPKPIGQATAKPTTTSIELPADQPTATSIELPADQPTATSIELPADQPTKTPTGQSAGKPIDLATAEPIDLPTAKPARKPAPRKRVAKATRRSIDLDRPRPADQDD